MGDNVDRVRRRGAWYRWDRGIVALPCSMQLDLTDGKVDSDTVCDHR